MVALLHKKSVEEIHRNGQTIEQFYREQVKWRIMMKTHLTKNKSLIIKRFLLFTIFIPVAWYVFLYNIQQANHTQYTRIAVFIGIIGNSLAIL